MARSRIQVSHGNDELTFANGEVSIGGRTGVDVVLEDVMVADRHCVIEHDGGQGFVVRDTGSVTGTWVDGKRAEPSLPLRDGATIVVGTSKATVAIGDDGGTATLELKLDPRSFWWQRAGKGAFDNDPDQLVYSETKFARFRELQLSNRVAILAGVVVLIAATFVSSVMEPLADPGPLLPSHATIASLTPDDPSVHAGIRKCVELSGEQGCDVCHTTGSGTPEKKCLQCHGLDGELGSETAWRHPYHEGYFEDATLASVPGMDVDEQFCVLCHTDHVTPGPDGGVEWLKPIAKDLLGDCAACHHDGEGTFDKQALIARFTVSLPAPVEQEFQTYEFPHDAHLSEEIACDVCHRVDEQWRAFRLGGGIDDPARHDFDDVPYEVCASCHVDGAAPAQMTAQQQQQWRAQEPEHIWKIDWHGTDDDGSHCLQCHAQRAADDGATVFGPERKTVARRVFTAELYRAERARYVATQRSHAQQFEQHAQGQACTQCHLDGKITLTPPLLQPARPFWHALHMFEGSLTPDDKLATSQTIDGSCASCHADLARGDATSLTPDFYTWAEGALAQDACRACHNDDDRLLPLKPARGELTAELQDVADFPHGAHVGSALYGQAGSTLADGCFACHTFSEPAAGDPFTQVPMTLPGAKDCTSCHAGHGDIQGDTCRICHPDVEGRSNSFRQQARDFSLPRPTRSWPAQNGFSHLSPGHVDESCASCHDGTGLDDAKTLADVRVPDESAQQCRTCHLEKQFHWR